jgi:coenzyme Q-binding protein COQ10
MAKYSQEIVLPYTEDQLFALIADVERYAEFVPWWTGAKVHREGDVVCAEQSFGLGIFKYRFSSQVKLHRPNSVQVTSSDGPFHQLEIHWQVQPRQEGGCTMTLSTEFRLRSNMLQRMFDGMGFQDMGWLLELFEQRAHGLYSNGDGCKPPLLRKQARERRIR